MIDNLLGGPSLCPMVRRTGELEAFAARRLDEEARALIRRYDQSVLARAVSYVYMKETRSSFEIEGETPSSSRAERSAGILRAAAEFDPTNKSALIRLKSEIVEPRYAERDWRTSQNFAGETIGGYRETVHFVAPKPEDVGDLISSWMDLTSRLFGGGVDQIVAAAVAAFAFVFIHPFEDGNGRIHHSLIHNMLARRGSVSPASSSRSWRRFCGIDTATTTRSNHSRSRSPS